MTREEFFYQCTDVIDHWLKGNRKISDLKEVTDKFYNKVTKLHWISVEDELPPFIDKNNPYGESVHVLFVVVLDGVQYINKGDFDYDTGVWHSLDMQCSFCKDNVTHWMPIPAPPSESVTTCNHKTSSLSEIPNNCKKLGMKGYENVVIHEGNAQGGILKDAQGDELPLPAPPVLSNSENIGKDLKGGEL